MVTRSIYIHHQRRERLQELKTKSAVRIDEATGRSVRVFLQSSFYTITGAWQWEMATEALFCTDVMFSLPTEVTGPRALFHPDDVAGVREILLNEKTASHLRFRIITTYGEVKTVMGENLVISAEEAATEAWAQQAAQTLIREAEQKKNNSHLYLLGEIDKTTSRFTASGTWYFNSGTNQIWYSDYVFSLHGLPGQALNAHLHTFFPFVHPEDSEYVTEFTDKAFYEKTPLHLEYRIVVDGLEKWVGYKSHWFYSERGEAVLGGIYQDITAQKTAELELDAYRNMVQFQRQQALYDEQQVNYGHWQVALLTRKTTYSDQYYRIFGLRQQSLAPTIYSFLNNIHPDDRDRVEATVKKIIYEHEVADIEYRIVRSDGKIRHILQKAKLVMYEGELLVSGIIQDITVQRMLEKKVSDMAEKLQQKTVQQQQSDEVSNSIGWVMDLEEKTIEWSDSFYRQMGFSKLQPSNITEKTLFTAVHPHDAKAFRKEWDDAVQHGQPASFEFRTMVRGAVRYMKAVFSFTTINEKDYFIGTVQDRTSEEVLQQQLSQRVQLAESLTENIRDRVVITDSHNTILLWNKACEVAYNRKKAEAVGQNLFDLFPHLKTENEMQIFQRVHRGEVVVQEGAFSALGNGYYNLHLMPLYQGNEVSGVLHVITDVTKETELRNSLHDRLQLIESIVQSSVDRIIALDRNMNYLYWNKKAEEYYRLPRERVVGKNILEVFPRLVNDPTYKELRRALKGETVHLPVNAEDENYSETYIVPIKGEKGEVVSLLWMAHDLTKEWSLRQQEREAQERLEKEHRRLKVAQAIGHVGSFDWDAATDQIFWSDEMYRIHGLEPKSEVITLEKAFSFLHPDEAELSRQLMRLRTEPGFLDLTHRIIRADGKERIVRRQLQSFANEAGNITHLSGTVQDITEQEEATQKLAANEVLLRSAEEVALTGSYEANLVTGIFRFSDGMYRLFGEEPGAFEPSLEFIDSRSHPDDVATVKNALDQAAINKQPYRYTRRIYRKDGRLRTVEARGKVICNAAGNAIKFIGLVQDITERLQAEQEILQRTHDLAESKKFAEQITQTTPDLITVHDVSTNGVVYTNHGDFLNGQYTSEELSKMNMVASVATMVQPDDREKATAFIEGRKLLQDNEVKEVELKMQAGGWIRIRSKVFKRDENGAALEIISFTTDITESKKAEQEVQKNLTILQNAEDLAQIGSWEYDIATDKFNWSEGMYRLFGLPQGTKVRPEIYLDFAMEEDRTVAKRIIKNLKKGYQPFEEMMHIKRADGVRLLKLKASVEHDKHGKPQRVLGVDVDITDIRNAEQKLEESKTMLQQTATASPDAITIYDLQKKEPLYLNDCLAKWLGTTSEALSKMKIDGRLEMIHPDDRLRLLHFNEKLKAAADGQVMMLEYRLRRSDGNLLWIRNRAKVFRRNASGTVTHLLSFLQDITEEKSVAQALTDLNASLGKKNAELESRNDEITSFAFVASHDLREPIRKIHTYSSWLLESEPALTEEGKKHIEKLVAAVQRLYQLADDVVALTKVHVDNEREKKVALNSILQQVKDEMKDQLEQSGAVIEADNLPVVTGAVNQLLYLFKNLFSNSLKFQPPGGVPHIRLHTERKDGYRVVSITDNGIGIHPDYHQKIFAMFRRLHSRDEYEGTGIGLAICKRIMEKHGGKITVQSNEGCGATFHCWFPE